LVARRELADASAASGCRSRPRGFLDIGSDRAARGARAAEVERTGLCLVDDGKADYALVGNTVGATFAWMATALHLLLQGARFVTVNADRTYVGPMAG